MVRRKIPAQNPVGGPSSAKKPSVRKYAMDGNILPYADSAFETNSSDPNKHSRCIELKKKK